MLKKIRSSKGESIAETLVALLIAALALLVLAGAITSTLRIINSSNKAMADYEAAQKTIITKDNAEATTDVKTFNGTISLQTSNDHLTFKQYNVTTYVNRTFKKTDVVSFERRSS